MSGLSIGSMGHGADCSVAGGHPGSRFLEGRWPPAKKTARLEQRNCRLRLSQRRVGAKGVPMRLLLAAALIGSAAVASMAAQSTQSSEPSGALERAFMPNGRISMDLTAGEYHI